MIPQETRKAVTGEISGRTACATRNQFTGARNPVRDTLARVRHARGLGLLTRIRGITPVETLIAVAGEVIGADAGAAACNGVFDTTTRIHRAGILAGVSGPLPEVTRLAVTREVAFSNFFAAKGDRVRNPNAGID